MLHERLTHPTDMSGEDRETAGHVLARVFRSGVSACEPGRRQAAPLGERDLETLGSARPGRAQHVVAQIVAPTHFERGPTQNALRLGLERCSPAGRRSLARRYGRQGVEPAEHQVEIVAILPDTDL